MALASLEAFTARLGRSLVDGPETDRAEAALDDASAYIETFGAIPGGAADPTGTVPPAIVAVACVVALRLFNNPEGLTSETVGSYTWRVDGAGLYLTEAEKATIAKATTDTSKTGLWSLSVTRGQPANFVYGLDQYGGDPILLADYDYELDGDGFG